MARAGAERVSPLRSRRWFILETAGSPMRHHGREYGYVVTGPLGVRLGFDESTLEPGDSIAFDSTQPHRLFNKGEVPVHAIWVVVGRATDTRVHE